MCVDLFKWVWPMSKGPATTTAGRKKNPRPASQKCK